MKFDRNHVFAHLRQHLDLLKWLVPVSLMLLVVVYKLGPGYWIYTNFNYRYNLLLDLLIFAAIGPFLAYVVLSFLERWLEERETSDLQAQILARARADSQKSRQLSDEALQLLFSASTIITMLKSTDTGPSSEIIAEIEDVEVAFNEVAERIRSHLLN
jgi:lysylphosphatidylglycerol synthetase-like protein (DUF2156 family)